MAKTTISDLPASRALDHKAMAAIRGGGGAPWVFGAFRAFMPAPERIVPIIFNQINLIANQLTLQFQNINVENSAPNAAISVNAGQNALDLNLTPVLSHP
ncbi:MAG: hypothetical protein HS128_04640 [Ideonella sp.]|nr:hypothetical protein [Ideonella sp.]MCC7455484.1 hypothetical protein [Nitrospira sp.]